VVNPATGAEYELEEPLGRGAYGVVYRARCVATGEWVVVKTNRRHEDPREMRRLQKAIQVRQGSHEAYVQ
jgi:serine/threonine protein kinase